MHDILTQPAEKSARQRRRRRLSSEKSDLALTIFDSVDDWWENGGLTSNAFATAARNGD
jgi:hypothetical protein